MKQKIIKLLDYAKTKPFHTGKNGYHTIKIKGETFAGQRNCNQRFQSIRNIFKNKIILDFGCNIGGSLFCISKDIKKGIGFDNNNKYINAANAIRSINNINNIDFYVFDIDKENLHVLSNFIYDRIDICMMLSIAKWIKKWKDLVQLCLFISDTLIFETNGHNQSEQIDYLEKFYDIEIIKTRSDDDVGQKNRILLLCKKKIWQHQK